ncbi:IS1096 element passenger TnpR family protein [Nocardia sp. NBC_00511]|uniref:IS1096 element passenger TnpR family protein n=1 Tax=Nocardia sp. NBC_00511 TaxID=2903591 RepID=UPI0030DE46F6
MDATRRARRTRRADVVTYLVRAESVKSPGRGWRGLELASDLFLDEVHDILTTLYGWQDKRRYRFGSGADFERRDSEHYLCRTEVLKRLRGIPDDEVRLDEVLIGRGDELFHRYGARPEWQRVLRLEAIAERRPTSARVLCVGGPERADIEAVNLSLSCFGFGVARDPDLDFEDLPEGLVQLSRQHHGRPRRLLMNLIAQAMLTRPVRIDRATAADFTRPFQSVLRHIGPDGVFALDGEQVPLAVALAIFKESDMQERWDDSEFHGDIPIPVRMLLESAEEIGLVRREFDRIVLTDAGLDLREDPLSLWWYLADQVSARVARASFGDPILLYVLAAATETDNVVETVAPVLEALDYPVWLGSGGTGDQVLGLLRETRPLLRFLHMTPRDQFIYNTIQHPAMRMFALAILRRWPRLNSNPPAVI